MWKFYVNTGNWITSIFVGLKINKIIWSRVDDMSYKQLWQLDYLELVF